MQKLNNIEAYRELREGQNAVFYHPQDQDAQARQIKMRLNAPQHCNLWLTPIDRIDPETGEVDEEEIFLGHIDPGLEQIEFFYRGSFALAVKGGNLWIDTIDNTEFSVEASDETSYARLWEREERDPRILEIEQAARHNQRMLMEQMAQDRAEYEARMRAFEEKIANVATPSAPADSGTTGAVAPVSSGTPASDSGAAAEPSGTDEGKPDASA